MLISDVPLAFTCGLFQPQIVISKGLFSSLNMAELKAVLLHERYHLKHFDPLKLSLVKSVRSALFFLHLAGHLCRCYEQLKELAADSSAISQIGEKVHLASALLKMLQYARPSSGAVLLVETNTAVDLRIAQLLSDKRTYKTSAKVQLFGSSAAVCFTDFLFDRVRLNPLLIEISLKGSFCTPTLHPVVLNLNGGG